MRFRTRPYLLWATKFSSKHQLRRSARHSSQIQFHPLCRKSISLLGKLMDDQNDELPTNILLPFNLSFLLTFFSCQYNNHDIQHPSIYRVTDDGISGTKTFTRVNNLDTSPYYRWDKSNAPEVVAFPPGFRMIAHSNDVGATQGGESGANMMTECCDMGPNGEEQCESWGELRFPTRTCSFLGIAMCKLQHSLS